MDALDFIQWRAKMCNERACETCKIGKRSRELFVSCNDFIYGHTEEEIEIVDEYKRKNEIKGISDMDKHFKALQESNARIEKSLKRAKQLVKEIEEIIYSGMK